jgi:hypothetical protein
MSIFPLWTFHLNVVFLQWQIKRKWLITGLLTRVTWRVSLLEQELAYLSGAPGIRVARSLIFCEVYWLIVCLFSFFAWQYVVCPSSASYYSFGICLVSHPHVTSLDIMYQTNNKMKTKYNIPYCRRNSFKIYS